jgi:uncharacterized Rmd1/YagE family protein
MYTPYMITPLSPQNDLLSCDVNDTIPQTEPLIPGLQMDNHTNIIDSNPVHRASFSMIPGAFERLHSDPGPSSETYVDEPTDYIDQDGQKFYVPPKSPRSTMLENWEAFVTPQRNPLSPSGDNTYITSVQSSGMNSNMGAQSGARPYGGFVYKDLVRKTTVPELFFFDYGVVVMWGLTEEEEMQILEDIRPFEEESISKSLSLNPEDFKS